MKKAMKKLAAAMIAMVAVVAVVGTSVPAEAAAKAPKKITLKATSSTVDIKGKTTVSVKSVTPANASKAVTYKSSNTKVATVSSKGVVTGKKAGKVTITATSKSNKKVKATKKITVKNLKPSSVTLSSSKLSLKVGAKKTVKATVKPAGVYCPVSYTSSNKSVATVSSTGVVTAKKPGTATITVKTRQKNSRGKYLTKTCKVTVTKDVEKVTQRQVYVTPTWVKDVIDGYVPEYKDAFISQVSWGEDVTFKGYYEKGIIPGSHHINSDAVEYDDCDPWPMGDGFDDFGLYDEKEVHPLDNFNLRSADQLATFLKRNNITKDTKVILYGKTASDSSVTRVAFAMIYAGVEDVKVINGGMSEWNKANLPTTTEVVAPTAGGDDYSFGTTIPAHPEYVMDIETVRTKLESEDNFRLVSIRSEAEFVGETSGYGYIDDSHAGEPKGAVWGHDTDDGTYVVDGKVATLKDMEALLAESGTDMTNEISFYCGTGWRATIPFLIAYQEGYENISLYDGGWWLWQLHHYGWEEKGIPAEPDKYPIQQITPDEASRKINYVSADDLMADLAGEKTFKLLDVRKAADYATAHVVGAVSADVDAVVSGTDEATATANIKAAIEGDSADTKYAVICYSGNRYAKAATKILKAAGVKNANIFTLQGGMKSWNEKYANYNVKSYTSTGGFEFTNGVTVDQVKADVEAENSVFTVFDLRTAVENAAGHIEGAVSTPLRVMGADASINDLSDEEGKANLKAAVEADPKGFYVLECYSGNKYANKAVGYLRELGVKEEQIIVLEGGASGWASAGNATVKSGTASVIVDKDAKSVTVFGVVNGKYLEEPTMHYMSTTGGTVGDKCLLEGLCDRLDLATALTDLGATAWNTTPGGNALDAGEYITAENGDNANYTHLDVNVTWTGNETPVSMADTLKTDDGSEFKVDQVFSNSKEVAAGYPTGCLLCTYSCFAGVTSNSAMPYNAGIHTVGNAEKLPAAGKIVAVTITVK